MVIFITNKRCIVLVLAFMEPQTMVGFQAKNKESEGKDCKCRDIRCPFNCGQKGHPIEEHRSVLQSAGMWGRTPGLQQSGQSASKPQGPCVLQTPFS